MKILLIKTEGAIPLNITQKHLKKIQSVDKNIQLVAVPSGNKKEITKHIKDAEVVAGASGVILPIPLAKNLKWIHAFSAGVEKILTPEVVKSKIIVSNSSGIHAIPIAEHVIGFILIFTRKFYDTFKKQQRKIWTKNQDLTELKDKTVLVVGLGNIGTEVARLTSCFGANVIAVKQNLKHKPDFVNEVYSINHLEKTLSKADFVVLCLPLTNETHHLFDVKKFKLMKKTAIIINIGRGGLINEKELIEALDKKIISGAGLDVTEEEPLSQKSRLWTMENVVITPHHSGWSEKYMDRAIDLFCINLQAYLANKPLPNLVDKTRGY